MQERTVYSVKIWKVKWLRPANSIELLLSFRPNGKLQFRTSNGYNKFLQCGHVVLHSVWLHSRIAIIAQILLYEFTTGTFRTISKNVSLMIGAQTHIHKMIRLYVVASVVVIVDDNDDHGDDTVVVAAAAAAILVDMFKDGQRTTMQSDCNQWTRTLSTTFGWIPIKARIENRRCRHENYMSLHVHIKSKNREKETIIIGGWNIIHHKFYPHIWQHNVRTHASAQRLPRSVLFYRATLVVSSSFDSCHSVNNIWPFSHIHSLHSIAVCNCRNCFVRQTAESTMPVIPVSTHKIRTYTVFLCNTNRQPWSKVTQFIQKSNCKSHLCRCFPIIFNACDSMSMAMKQMVWHRQQVNDSTTKYQK